jgi:general secretion pathway protein F
MVLSIIFLIVTSIVIGYKKSVKFKYNIDKILLLKIPYISKLLMTQQMYIFFLVLKVLIKSGYKLQEALISSKTIIINCFFVSKIENINNYLKQGKDISGSFNNINIFDTLTIRLLLAGEKTNNMNSIMEKLEIIYEQRLQNSIKKISSYLEPILVAIIGFVILFIMLAIFLPIWQMGTVLK